MKKQIISLIGALGLMMSASGQASINEDVFNRLDNDSEYINMNADQQNLFDTVVEQSIANMEEKGLVLTDTNAQMFLISTIKGFLGLSKGKEDKKMPAAAPAEEGTASPAANSLNQDLLLVESNGQYFLIDTITGAIGKVVNAGKNLLGIGKDKAPEPAAPTGTVFNAMDGGLSLTDANAQYGAIWDSIKGGLSGVAQAISDKLKPKDKDAPAEAAPPASENSLGQNLILVDANAQYGALWDSIRSGLSGVAQAVSDKLKPKDKNPEGEAAPAASGNSLSQNLVLVDANAQYGAILDSIRSGLSGVAQAVSDKLKPKDKSAPAPAAEEPAGE